MAPEQKELLTAIGKEAVGYTERGWRDFFTLDPESWGAAKELEYLGYLVLEPPGEDQWFRLRLTEKGVAAARGFASFSDV